MIAASSFAAGTAPALSATTLASAIIEARAIVQSEMAAKVPGFSVAVAVDGTNVWSEGFGYADLEGKTPVTTATRFRIGSVSKAITAAGLALLVEQGRIDLDAPIQKYVPDFPLKEGVITTRLLAGHLSGIRNYRGSEAASSKQYLNLRSGLKLFEDDPLIAPPGTKFSYASYNWNVIGVAMEAAAKQDFLRYMDEHVIQPLGLKNTVPDRARVVDPQRSQFYETTAEGTFIIAPKVNLSFVWPAGGYLSTTEDMARFGSAMLQPGFLKPESLRMLFASQTTADGKLTHYGVGWYVGKKIFYHGGDSVGGTALLLLFPEARTVVALACNRGHLAIGRENGRAKSVKLADGMEINREVIAARIVKVFAPLSAHPAQGK